MLIQNFHKNDTIQFSQAKCLEHMMEHNRSLNLKRNSYIRSIAKDFGKITSSLYPENKYLIPHARLYICENGVLLPHLGWSCPLLAYQS